MSANTAELRRIAELRRKAEERTGARASREAMAAEEERYGALQWEAGGYRCRLRRDPDTGLWHLATLAADTGEAVVEYVSGFDPTGVAA